MAYGITGRGFRITTDTHGIQYSVRSQEGDGEDATPWPCRSFINTSRRDRLRDTAAHWWNGIRSNSVFDENECVNLPEANSRHLTITDSVMDGSRLT
jgi:hypothetical protein